MQRWRTLSFLWAGVIFVTSCTVVKSKAFVHSVATVAPVRVTETGFQRFWSSWWWLLVKGYHMLEFAILTYLIARWLSSKPVWTAVLCAGIYAATDEIHQLWVPERGARFTDWLIDMSGVMIAAVVVLWQRVRPRNEVAMQKDNLSVSAS